MNNEEQAMNKADIKKTIKYDLLVDLILDCTELDYNNRLKVDDYELTKILKHFIRKEWNSRETALIKEKEKGKED